MEFLFGVCVVIFVFLSVVGTIVRVQTAKADEKYQKELAQKTRERNEIDKLVEAEFYKVTEYRDQVEKEWDEIKTFEKDIIVALPKRRSDGEVCYIFQTSPMKYIDIASYMARLGWYSFTDNLPLVFFCSSKSIFFINLIEILLNFG